MKDVSHTSQWTAAARAVETEREDSLFKDTLARGLAGSKGFELLARYGGGGLKEFVAIRTRYLDDVINATVMKGTIRQVVLIAAGMDARAFRLEWPQEATVFEVDHTELHQEKQVLLDSLSATATVVRRVVEVDLTSDWLPALFRAGFDSKKPTLWVAEALLFFLTDGQTRSLLDRLAAISAKDSVLTADVLSAALLRHIGTQPFLQALRNDGIPWLFGTDKPEEYFQRSGWQITELKEPGQEGAGLGRWPYRLYSRGVANVPRNWLLQAKIMEGPRG